MEPIKQLWARVQASDAWKAWQRYGSVRGNLLAGGVTYFAFFSVFPAVALAFTVFGLVLRDKPEMLEDIRRAIDQQLPGFVKSPDGKTGLIPIEIPSGTTLGITALIGVAGLLWAGLGWLGALRDGIRAVFGAKGAPGNFITAKLRDLLVLALLGVGVVLVAGVSTVANSIASRVAEGIGIDGAGWLVTIVGLIVSVIANTGLVALMLRVLSGVDLPWRALRNGAVFGGVAMTLLQTFGTRLIAGTMGNPLFGSIALVVGLLAFLNFIARAMLLSAAWAANDTDTQALAAVNTVTEGARAKLLEGPPTRTAAAAALGQSRGSALPQDTATRAAVGLPTFDARAADRVSVAAGAVIGAAAAAATGMALRTVRSLLRRG